MRDSIEKTIKKISIPFICIVIVAVRFIMESAIFHIQRQSSRKMKNLPPSLTMIKYTKKYIENEMRAKNET